MGIPKMPAEYELPPAGMAESQKLAHEPEHLKAGDLRTITKDKFVKYELEEQHAA